MLRHLPEGVVPFDDCGYSRIPVQPMTGQEIYLECQCDGEASLEIEGLFGVVRSVGAGRFLLPAQEDPCHLRYRFVCVDETTRWFEVDVLRPVQITYPMRMGEGWAQLCPNAYLTAERNADGMTFRLMDEQPADHSVEGITFGHPFWSVTSEGQVVLQCESISLGLREDGSVAYQRMLLRGGHHHVYGTGERFDAVDQQGSGSCGQVVEHFTQQGEWSYLPVPAFLTDGGFGFYRGTGCNVAMRFGDVIEVASAVHPGMEDHVLLGCPAQQLRGYIQRTGTPALPPEWAFGLWISANGWNNDAEVDEQLRQMKMNDYPASVMVLEAWSDESTFYRWSGAWSDAVATVKKIRESGLHLVLWQIPVLKALKDCPDQESVRLDREEAVRRGLVVCHEDGTPYVIPERWFEGSLLPDFTNPETCSWWFAKRDHLLDAGVEGFKTDGGEFLFGSDVRLADGTRGAEAHNLYPMHYERAYHAWMRSRGVEGVLFSRAGYAGAQTVPIHWAGDQLSTWPELRAQLNAGLSAGLSGVLFWSFDIGGFAGELPEAELYLRATAMGCFSPVMQWHAEPRNGQFYETHDAAFNNDRSPWNLAAKLNDPSLLEISCRFARLREQLRSYLWEEAQYCVQAARPMMAHLCLDFPEDAMALSCHDEYMLGRKYLVAPVLEARAAGRKVYLPRGRWKHFFTGEVFIGGMAYELPCPLDQALVFDKMEA